MVDTMNRLTTVARLLAVCLLHTNSATSSNSFPIGLILGPALAGLNVGIAATANNHFRNELEEYNVLTKEIKPGETAYGLIGLQSRDVAPLRLMFNNN